MLASQHHLIQRMSVADDPPLHSGQIWMCTCRSCSIFQLALLSTTPPRQSVVLIYLGVSRQAQTFELPNSEIQPQSCFRVRPTSSAFFFGFFPKLVSFCCRRVVGIVVRGNYFLLLCCCSLEPRRSNKMAVLSRQESRKPIKVGVPCSRKAELFISCQPMKIHHHPVVPE